ncbi:MAG: hypothetical protein ACRD2E_03075 [Terriglobales bacterium]
MADFTHPIPPVTPGEYPADGQDAKAAMRPRPARPRRAAGLDPAEESGEPAEPEPAHELDESA